MPKRTCKGVLAPCNKKDDRDIDYCKQYTIKKTNRNYCRVKNYYTRKRQSSSNRKKRKIRYAVANEDLNSGISSYNSGSTVRNS